MTKGRVAVFSTQAYDEKSFAHSLEKEDLQLHFLPAPLTQETAALATGHDAVCVFVNDVVDSTVLDKLAEHGVNHIALRCAGYNNVDLAHAASLGIAVSHVPAYSPEAVAEHAVALMLTLNRRMHKAYNRVREGNFDLNGLLGFTLHGKTVGVVGTGHIGAATAKILLGFGCKVLCFDPYPNASLIASGVNYVEMDELFAQSHVISLHCPLNEQSHHMINRDSLAKMRDGVMLINTSRGGLIDTKAIIDALKQHKIGYLGLDVYEMESELFFKDHSFEIIQDDVFERLQTFHNVLITGHQGFFTHEALSQIAHTTFTNIRCAISGNLENGHFLVAPSADKG